MALASRFTMSAILPRSAAGAIRAIARITTTAITAIFTFFFIRICFTGKNRGFRLLESHFCVQSARSPARRVGGEHHLPGADRGGMRLRRAHERLARPESPGRGVDHHILDPRLAPRRHVVPHQGQRPDDSAAGLRGEKRCRRVRRHCPQPLPGRGLQPRRKLRHQPPERFEQRIGDLGHLSHLKFHFSTKITFLTETLRLSAEKSVLLLRRGPRLETAHKITVICKIILSL